MPLPSDRRKIPWHLRYRTGQGVMTDLRKLMIRATHQHCHVEFQGPVRLGPGFQLDIPDSGTLIVAPGVDFRRGFVCEIQGNGRVVIGGGTIFSSNALIQCSTSIEIGQRCTFGQSVLIVDGYHRYTGLDSHWLDQGYDYVPITIGDGAGVSDKCTIQASIGERAMIASQSVVNRDIPAYCVAAGAPARVVRYFGPEELRPDGVTPTPTPTPTPKPAQPADGTSA
ncbi:MAG: Acetyltransferase (isoleucine patch superfamily)-like protein [Acidimicrobiales bacterium]|nr:Acetyltransferase (isoleucine patch superfamily)-like protein [Acidimicrobiales bacterium]